MQSSTLPTAGIPRIVRESAVRLMFGFGGRSSTQDAVRDQTITKPVRVSKQSVGWPEAEMQTLVSARAAGASDSDMRALVARLHAARHEAAIALGLTEAVAASEPVAPRRAKRASAEAA